MALALALTMALLAAARGQDPDPEALLDRFSDESVVVRGEAAADLIRLGEKAIPAVKRRLGSATGEAWRLCEGILGTIERERRLREFRAPARRITLEAKDKPLAEVFDEFERGAGFSIVREGIPASKV